MSDPRKPQRPDGDAGSNWVRCKTCGREAAKLRLIRHAKQCPAREEIADAKR